MPNRRVLVTGANGMLGRALLARLAERWPHAELLGIDINNTETCSGIACDLSDITSTREALVELDPSVVFHCAGAVAGEDITLLTKHLLAPTKVLIKALQTEGMNAIFVLPGSAAEYGTLRGDHPAFSEEDSVAPASPYGVVKVAQTGMVLKAAEAGLDTRVGRIFNLIGPGVSPMFLPGRVASRLAEIAEGRSPASIQLGPLSSVRDFIDIRDACDGLLAVAQRGVFGRVYNICSGVGRTTQEAVDTLVRCSGLDVEIVSEPALGSPRVGLEASIGDPSRTARELHWRPSIDFETSACDAVAAAKVR